MECQKNKDNINKIQQKRQAKTIPIKESEEELKGEMPSLWDSRILPWANRGSNETSPNLTLARLQEAKLTYCWPDMVINKQIPSWSWGSKLQQKRHGSTKWGMIGKGERGRGENSRPRSWSGGGRRRRTWRRSRPSSPRPSLWLEALSLGVEPWTKQSAFLVRREHWSMH